MDSFFHKFTQEVIVKLLEVYGGEFPARTEHQDSEVVGMAVIKVSGFESPEMSREVGKNCLQPWIGAHLR